MKRSHKCHGNRTHQNLSRKQPAWCWIRVIAGKLPQKRRGESPEKGQAITDTQRQIQALKAQIKRLEREKAILEPVYDPVKSTVCKRYSGHFEPVFCYIRHDISDRKQVLKKGDSALHVGHAKRVELFDILSAEYPKRELSRVFDIPRSTYYSYQQRKNTVNAERERLKAKVVSLHQASRQAAGSRTLTGQLKQQGERVGRDKVRRSAV